MLGLPRWFDLETQAPQVSILFTGFTPTPTELMNITLCWNHYQDTNSAPTSFEYDGITTTGSLVACHVKVQGILMI